MKSKEFIEERENSYKVHIPYTDELGNRKFYSKSFLFKKYGTKQKALEFAKNHRDEMRVKFANGMIINKKKYTLDEIFEESMKVYNATLGTKKKVNCTYKNYIQKFIGGNRDFATIKYNDIQKNLNELQSIAKDDTIARTTAIWRRIYRYAVAMDIVMKDETYNITTPKSDIITIKKPMSVSFEVFVDTLQKIDCCVKDRRESKLIQGALWIMYYTGMRPSEVLALESHNIDFEYRDIFVCESVGTTSIKKNTIRKTKNESSIRHIPIFNDELEKILRELIDLSPNGYIFTRNNGELMNGTYLANVCNYLTKGQFRPYMLRHQFSTDLLLKGTDLRTIQELMGHKESSMTLGYARSNDELKINALKDRNKLIN